VTPKSLGIIAGPFFFPGLEHEIAASGAEVLLADGRLFWDLVAERAQADGVKNLGFEKDWLSYDRYARVRKALAEEIALTPSDDQIRHVRAVKDAGEIEQLRRAADVGDRAFLGEPEAQLVEIYTVVRAAQDATVEALRSGVRRGRDVDAAARKVLDDAGYGDKFIHGLGHGIGLAVHELPSMGRLRVNTPEMDAELAKNEQVPEDTVVTNEPGVYLGGWGGVRLEDMLLVTKDGVEVISERNPEQIISLPVR
jgi:Xaa-Pro aminopeptidase